MADGSIVIDTSVDGSGLKNGLSKLGSVAGTAVKGVTVAIGAVSTALTAAGGYAIKVGSDFEAAMSQVAAISGATGSELDQLKEKAKEMGASTKFSATESAEAFNYMAMAGWKTADMLDGIEGIMNLAAASGEDLARVSDIVTDSLTAFGLKAADSAHFADVLAKASASSNTNVSMMGQTFKYVAPLAGSLGYSIEDVAVAVGLMASGGIKGEQAGTALRGALTRLVKPTDDVTSKLIELGLATETYANIVDSGKIDKANNAIAKSQESLASKSIAAQKAQITYNAAVDKYGKNSSQAQKAALSLQNAQNKLASAQEKLSASQDKLNAAQEGGIQATGVINNLLADSTGKMRPFSDVIVDLRKAFRGLSQEEQAQAAATLFGQEAMSGMLNIINASDEDFEKLTAAIADADGASRNMADTMNDNLQGQLALLKSALEGLGIEFYEQIDAPAKTVVERVIGYVDRLNRAIAGFGLKSGSAEWQEAYNELIDQGFSTQEALTKLNGSADLFVKEIGSAFADAVSEIASATPMVIESAVSVIQSFLTGIQSNLPQIADAVIGIAVSLVEGIIVLLPQFLAVGGELVLQLAMGIEQNLPSLLEKAAQTVQSLLQGFTENIPQFLDVAANIIAELVSGLGQAAPELLPAALEALLTFAEGLLDNVDKLIDAALELVMGLAEGIINSLPVLLEKAPEVVQKLVDAIISNAPKLATAALNIIVELVKGIILNLPQLFQSAIEIIGAIVGGIIEYKGNLLTAVLEIVRTIWDNITSVDWLQLGKDIIAGIGQGFSDAAGNLARSAKDAVDGALQSAKDFLGIRSPSRVFRDVVGKNMILGIAEGVDTEMPALSRRLEFNISDMVNELEAAVAVESSATGANAAARLYTSASSTVNLGGIKNHIDYYGGGSPADADGLMRRMAQKTQQSLRAKGVRM